MQIKVALAGNPNTGKTTLFNALTGMNQYVGNWPGVTVEKKEGYLKNRTDVIIVDLPGVYSLSPYSLEEVVARSFLINERPDAIINLIDGTNLARNLYLTTQLTELGIPVVAAVNMIDVLKKNGDTINVDNLAKSMGCKAIEISALKNEGILEAAELAVEAAKNGKTLPKHRFSGIVEHTLAHIEEAVLHDMPDEQQRWHAIKLFERDSIIREKLNLGEEKLLHIENDIKRCENELDDDSESIITTERYTYIDSVINDCRKLKTINRVTVSDKIDRVLTNRILALPVFAVIMFLVYFISVTTVGSFVTDWTNDGLFGEGFDLFGLWVPGVPVLIGGLLESINCAEWLQGLIIDGIVAGVGAVLGFVPQIFILFLFLAFLEGCGYMSRIAFILDRAFRKFGLSGKSFIPILIGTGCGVPGIMASRTIENGRDRKMTIITTTFIPCSAKLPVIALIAGAMFGGAWWVAPSAYFIGIASIICSGIILKKTRLFSGDTAPFVMELPPYHLPTAKNVLRSTGERGWSFIKKAGTIVLLSAVVVWFTSNFGFKDGSFGMVEMSDSILAATGSAIAWIFSPLGWGDWQPAVATLTGLIAKENIVGVFGILFGAGGAIEGGESLMLNDALFESFTYLAAFSFLVFNLLCAPCVAAIGAIRREMNNTKWLLFAIAYQCLFAYMVSLFIYQFGNLFSLGKFGAGTVAASIAAIGFGWLLFRPAKIKKM